MTHPSEILATALRELFVVAYRRFALLVIETNNLDVGDHGQVSDWQLIRRQNLRRRSKVIMDAIVSAEGCVKTGHTQTAYQHLSKVLSQ